MKCFNEIKTNIDKVSNFRHDSHEKASSLIYCFLEGILLLSVFLSTSGCFMFTPTSTKDGVSVQLSGLAAKSQNNRLYAEFLPESDDLEGNINFCSSVQRYVSSSFYTYGNAYCAIDSGSGSPTSFNFSVADESLAPNSIAACPLFLWANSNNVKFECLNLDLFSHIADEKRYVSGTYGSVYIPDFFADKIIADNPSIFGDYSAIISKNAALSVEIGGVSYPYRIANIFRQNGFTHGTPDARKHDDGLEGQRIANLLGSNFVVVVESTSVRPFHNFRQIAYIDYSGSQFLTKYWMNFAVSLSEQFSVIFSYLLNDSMVVYKNSRLILDAYTKGFTSNQSLYFSLMFVLSVLIIGSLFFVYFKFVKNCGVNLLPFSFLIISPSFVTMAMFYLLLGVSPSSISVVSYQFLNIFGSSVTIILSFCLFFLYFFKQREKQCLK